MLYTLGQSSTFEKGPISILYLKKNIMDSQTQKNSINFLSERKILKFSFTKETDLCTNCWSQKAVLKNITYEYFDRTFKFSPVCVDCSDIDEFNKSTSIFLGRQ